MSRRCAPVQPARDDEGLMAALGAVLQDQALEPAFIALTLSPPSEADIAREIGRDVDPDAVFAARRKLRAAIGERHGAALADTYERMTSTPAPTGRTRKAPGGAFAQEYLSRPPGRDRTQRRPSRAPSRNTAMPTT